MQVIEDRAPLIGFTAREGSQSYFLSWQRDYWFCILLEGGSPLQLAPDIVHNISTTVSELDGLLLTGGGDIDPQIYGQALDGADEQAIYPRCDGMEIDLVQECIRQQVPLLGICRGLQVVNVALGGSLKQHHDGHTGVAKSFDNPLVHEISVRHRSLLDRILEAGDQILVNSYHHQSVMSEDLARPLRASAIAADGVVEAVEYQAHPWFLAVQWHPERLYELDPCHRRLFSAFVEAALRRQSQRAGSSEASP